MLAIGIILIVFGGIALICSFAMFGDIGVSCFFASIAALLSGIGFVLGNSRMNKLESKIRKNNNI